MPNVDIRTGFTPIDHLTGGAFRTREYIVTTGQTIYQGDLVSVTTAGTVSAAAAGAGTIVVGVAAEYVSDAASAGGKKIKVYDDPDIIFAVQTQSGVTTSLADSMFITCDHVTTHSGSSTTKQSGHECSATAGSGLVQMRIIGLVESPDNAWGEHSKVKVILAEHLYRVTTTVA